MPVSPARRLALLVVLVVVSFQCTSFSRKNDVFCRSGNGSKSHPLICVDDKTLTASPNPAHVFDREAKDSGPSDRAVVINWYAMRTADLQIKYGDNTSCTDEPQCDGRGHCWATVKRLQTPVGKDGRQQNNQCKYRVTLGNTKYDPDSDIVVEPCCW